MRPSLEAPLAELRRFLENFDHVARVDRRRADRDSPVDVFPVVIEGGSEDDEELVRRRAADIQTLIPCQANRRSRLFGLGR